METPGKKKQRHTSQNRWRHQQTTEENLTPEVSVTAGALEAMACSKSSAGRQRWMARLQVTTSQACDGRIGRTRQRGNRKGTPIFRGLQKKTRRKHRNNPTGSEKPDFFQIYPENPFFSWASTENQKQKQKEPHFWWAHFNRKPKGNQSRRSRKKNTSKTGILQVPIFFRGL